MLACSAPRRTMRATRARTISCGYRMLSIEVTGTSTDERSTWGDVEGVPLSGTSEMPAA